MCHSSSRLTGPFSTSFVLSIILYSPAWPNIWSGVESTTLQVSRGHSAKDYGATGTVFVGTVSPLYIHFCYCTMEWGSLSHSILVVTVRCPIQTSGWCIYTCSSADFQPASSPRQPSHGGLCQRSERVACLGQAAGPAVHSSHPCMGTAMQKFLRGGTPARQSRRLQLRWFGN